MEDTKLFYLKNCIVKITGTASVPLYYRVEVGKQMPQLGSACCLACSETILQGLMHCQVLSLSLELVYLNSNVTKS